MKKIDLVNHFENQKRKVTVDATIKKLYKQSQIQNLLGKPVVYLV